MGSLLFTAVSMADNGNQGQMDIEIIAVSRYGCSKPLLGGRRIVSAVARRMEIKLALFARSPSGPPCDPFFIIICVYQGGTCGASGPQNRREIENFSAAVRDRGNAEVCSPHFSIQEQIKENECSHRHDGCYWNLLFHRVICYRDAENRFGERPGDNRDVIRYLADVFDQRRSLE